MVFRISSDPTVFENATVEAKQSYVDNNEVAESLKGHVEAVANSKRSRQENSIDTATEF